MYDEYSGHAHTHAQNLFAVIPTVEKLNADTRFTGRGVRIAFLDSGFYPHRDFASRVVEFHDISGEETSFFEISVPEPHHWHGTQTVTVCAGDGSLSDGVYRALATDAELVLVKASRRGRVGDPEIEEGLRWVIDNQERLSIRILNISLGGDCDPPTADSGINLLIEALHDAGVVVTVAAGNTAERRSAPPASAPSAITVGGYSDENQFDSDGYGLYHSSHGTTADGLVKPELIAPAMFVAAPILPGTADFERAEKLSMLAGTPDYALPEAVSRYWRAAGLTEFVLERLDTAEARRYVESELLKHKVVATHYQHVDGTSFAAPITASVAAQMLEANSSLTPAAVKNILVSTAKRLGGHPAVRQGFGVLNARLAVELAQRESHLLDHLELPPPRLVGGKIIFRYHNDGAHNVALAGDLTKWSAVDLVKCSSGIWEATIDCQPAGKYRYKFRVDGERWIEDPSHGLKEDDGFGGFNSILLIE